MGFILLAGMLGSGKTGVAQQFAGQAAVLHADLIQHALAEVAFPFLDHRAGLGKRLMVTHRPHLDLKGMCRAYVAKRALALEGVSHVLIEGEIVSRRWFIRPLLDALREAYPVCRAWDVARFVLAPPAEVVFARIQRRAQEWQARSHEAKVFETLALVEERRAWYFETLRNSGRPWEVHEGAETLREALAGIVSPSTASCDAFMHAAARSI